MPEQIKKPPYRPLNIKERDMLFAFYEKWNGNMSEMILDRDCVFKGYTQIRYYAKLYHFEDKLVEIRRKRAEKVNASLVDAKIKSIERALELLQTYHVTINDKMGNLVCDLEGKPILLEKHPHYKEIVAAWQIIKTELGEPTNITKTENKTDLNIVEDATEKLNNFLQDVKARTAGTAKGNT